MPIITNALADVYGIWADMSAIVVAIAGMLVLIIVNSIPKKAVVD